MSFLVGRTNGIYGKDERSGKQNFFEDARTETLIEFNMFKCTMRTSIDRNKEKSSSLCLSRNVFIQTNMRNENYSDYQDLLNCTNLTRKVLQPIAFPSRSVKEFEIDRTFCYNIQIYSVGRRFQMLCWYYERRNKYQTKKVDKCVSFYFTYLYGVTAVRLNFSRF